MSTRALIRAIQHLLSQPSKLAQRVTKKIVTGFLRNLLLVGRRPRMSRAGFVLPTTVLLLLVATLTVGSITYRTYTRTTQTIGDRQQRVIYNAATPAIDRARAKLEFLFDPQKDPRFPGGIPGEGRLAAMLLNNGSNGVQALPGQDVYTLPDETRIDINGNGVDNAWRYRVDTDEDGVEDATVAYSLLFQIPANGATPAQDELPRLTDSTDAAVRDRANKLQVRRGPLSSVDQLNNACRRQAANTLPEAGWIPDGVNTSTLRKNFQIDAFVLPDRPTGTVTTLEFYQDRQVNRGNKWGAWFRNDLEIFPGAAFNWNGAMHTEGSLIVGKPQPAADRIYNSYLISSPFSCLYTKDASEVSVAAIAADNAQDIPEFRGQIISGRTGTNEFEDGSRFHLFNGAGVAPTANNEDATKLLEDTDSIGDNSGAGGPADFALDPVALLTEGISKARNGNSVAPQDPDWETTQFFQKGRIINKLERAPYLDDSFRADNRYGPKPRYDNKKLPDVVNIGAPITGDLMSGSQLPDNRLINDAPAVLTDATSVGLDGYWERRARAEGVRLIVGQRLELGNPYPETLGGYATSGLSNNRLPRREPLRPWRTCTPNTSGDTRCNEARQRRTLIDNLAAVQATAVYHYANPTTAGGPDFPLACLATTAHPGTSVTLDRSTTFEDLALAAKANGNLDPALLTTTDFFSGRGTNGWEYEPPAAAGFPSAEMRKALGNLANFAGDPEGGSPSFTPNQTDGYVHPYPSMAMWGDFSMLRRILDSGTPYASLSPADKTTLHTAACALGMLAYNMNYMAGYNYGNPNPNLNALAVKIGQITDGNPNNSDGINLATGLAPEIYIDGLRRWRDANPGGQAVLNELIPLAQLVMEKEQIERDRKWGFNVGGKSPNCANTFAGVNLGQPNKVELARLCSSQPKYPILFSLFPGDYNEDGVVNASDNHGEVNGQSRDAEDTSDTYIASPTVNGPANYQFVDLNAIQLRPRQIANWVTPHETITPNRTTANSNRDTLIKECVTATCYRNAGVGSLVRVAFKDSGMYNAREMMGVRTMDINLDLLRRTAYGTGDYWLPVSGVIYAFREDAVSENSIVRPSSGAGMEGTGTAEAKDAKDPALGTYNISPKPVDYYPDPDRRPHGFRLRQGIALWRGATLTRTGDNGRGLSFISDNPVYIQGDFNRHRNAAGTGPDLEEFQTRLTANLGNFYTRNNIDTSFAALTTDQWRPTEILADSVTILSDNFCDGSVEDGIITAGQAAPSGANLSTRLGRERSGETGAVYGCQIGTGTTAEANVRTSYLNQNRPTRDYANTSTFGGAGSTTQGRWLRANPYDSGSPIVISRSGNPINFAGTPVSEYGANPNEGYSLTSEARPLSDAPAETRVNAIIISGILPSRQNQSYGGMHNFPRLLENWTGKRLYIAGSFLQLNFSNYATGPFDQDAFEVGSATLPDSGGGELIKYYDPPTRVWGYDVGLQYAPAGPIAQRFVTFASIRSEFYEEPPANDPYISNLCRAINAARCPA